MKARITPLQIGWPIICGLIIVFGAPLLSGSAGAVEIGWQKLIDDGFNIGDTDPNNWHNCGKICSDCEVETPGKCAEICTAEFFCAGPWRSYPWPDGQIVGNAYLYLSSYGATQPTHPRQTRKGWAAWQWQVGTSGRYKVEVMYRPTHNRSPDADYYVLTLKSLGVFDGSTEQAHESVNQRFIGPLKSSGWYSLGEFDYYKGEVAAVGLWAQDDEYSDEVDAVRWTLQEKLPDPVPPSSSAVNSLLLSSPQGSH